MAAPESHTQCPARGHRHRLTDLTGLTAVVTGGATGIGYFTAEGLAALGARVVIAGRNADRFRAAQHAIQARIRGAEVSYQPLDLADLSTVRAAAERLAGLPTLDLLVANAGAIGYPNHVKPGADKGIRGRTTADGQELFWGTNFLGHYALVALLFPLINASNGRCVLVGSIGDRGAPLAADAVPRPDLRASDLAKYGQSKLATTTLMHELARRLARHGGGAAAVGAHPGTAVDFLSPPRAGVATNQPDGARLLRAPVRLFAHGKHDGALPVLTAAACPEARNGDYWGPRRITKGPPVLARSSRATQDPVDAARLMDAAAALTGLTLPLG